MRAYVIGAFVLTASWAAACGSDDEGDGAADPTDAGGSGGTAGSSTGGGGGGGTGGRGSGGTPSGGTGNTGGTLPEGSVGGASTDGSAPDGSAGDASVGADGAAPTDAGPCTVLEACCDTVQAIFEASCRSAVSTSTAQECSVLQGFFCTGGGPEGGGPPQPDAGGCAALQACCEQLTGVQQTQCNTIAGTGNPLVCNATMGMYCP